MHIAILTPGFAIDERDTNCVPALQDFLLASRHRVPSVEFTVFALRYPHTRRPYDWHGIPVHPADGRRRGFPLSLFSRVRLVRGFAGVTRRKPVEIIHSFWLGECAALGERLSRLYRVPHVVTLMGQEVALPNRYAGLLKSERATFVAVSPFQRSELLKRTGRDTHHTIPWGLDALPSQPTGPRDIDVLGAGSLTAVKDFHTFVEVISLLRATRPTLSCRIAGDGPLRAALEAKAKDLRLQDNVTFEGRLSRERVLDLMRRSKVLLHTSTFESFGLVFAEALACGARIVSRPVGIAEPGEKWAVCGNAAGMAAAVSDFLGAADFTPHAVHPIERTVDAYHTLYRAVVARR